MKLSYFAVCGLSMLLACTSGARDVAGDMDSIELGREAVVGGTASGAADDAVIFFGDPSQTNGMMCTAVMVTPRIALTARHCVSTPIGDDNVECSYNGVTDPGQAVRMQIDKSLSVFRAYTGAKAVGETASSARVQNIDVDTSTDESCFRDFAVVTFDRDVTSKQASVRSTDVSVGEKLRLVGYGAVDDSNSFVDQRQTRGDIVVEAIGPGTANRATGPKAVYSEGTILTGPGFCSGDSGGPLLDGDGHVVGLVSRKLGPCSTSKNIYVGMKHVLPVLQLAEERLNVAPADAGAEDSGAPKDAGAAASNEAAAKSSGCSARTLASSSEGYVLVGLGLMCLVASRRVPRSKDQQR